MGFNKLSRSYIKTKLAIDIPQPCPLCVQDKTYAFFLFWFEKQERMETFTAIVKTK